MSNTESTDRYTGDIERINEFALQPLGLLHAEGWGPDAVEIDQDAGEVKFVFTRALDTDTDRSERDA